MSIEKEESAKKIIFDSNKKFMNISKEEHIKESEKTKINEISNKKETAVIISYKSETAKNNVANKNIDNCIQVSIKENSSFRTFDVNNLNKKPPNVSKLYLNNYKYENENDFSCLNNTLGKLKKNKRVPNIFYNHLIVCSQFNDDKKYSRTSTNKRYHGKVLTIIYYSYP